MNVLLALIFVFVFLPWLELTLLLYTARAYGVFTTLAIVVFTGIAGGALARAQGAAALFRVRQAMAEGRMPADEILDGFLIFAAGLLLITPGLITDSVGFLLLIPPARAVLKRGVGLWIRRHLREVTYTTTVRRGPFQSSGPDRTSDPDVIDVQAKPVDDEDDRP